MEKNRLTVLGFARTLGVARYTLQRYLHQGRLPPPKVLAKLHALSKGAVQPNDFYDLTAKKKPKSKAKAKAKAKGKAKAAPKKARKAKAKKPIAKPVEAPKAAA